MADRVEFRAKLGEILKFAIGQSNRITVEEVEKYFSEDQLTEEQIQLVCEYLMAQKVTVAGYQKEKAEENPLSEEEKEYLEVYKEDLASMRPLSAQEEKLTALLPKVVDVAMELHHPEIFIGDMIQEGNISLMLALETLTDEKSIMEEVRSCMRMMIEAQTETKRQDKKMVEKVSELDVVLEEMNDEFGRKVTLDEVAERLGISEEQVEDILKLAGESAEDEEEEE